MATKVHTKTIPSTFQKLDSVTGSADIFFSVYHQRKMLENFNILLARRARRNIATEIYGGTPLPVGLFQLTDLSVTGKHDWKTLIRVNPWTRTLYIAAMLSCEGILLLDTVYLHAEFVPLPFGKEGQYIGNDTDLSVDFYYTSGTGNEGELQEMELAIEPGASGWGILSFRGKAEQAAGVGAGGATDPIIDVGNTFVDVDSSGAGSGHAYAAKEIVSFSDTNIEPQVIIRSDTIGTNQYRCHLPDPWRAYPPIVGTTTADFWTISPVYIHSLHISEKPITQFGQ